MTNRRFDALFGGPPRSPDSPLSQREMDLAASIQAVTEDVVLKVAREARRSTGQKNLCMAGGVALNCVANGVLQREKVFENIWVQPAAGDAGGAVGAALAAYHMLCDGQRHVDGIHDSMKGAYLGPSYDEEDCQRRLTAMGAVFQIHRDDELVDYVAQAIAQGSAVGWHQGRSEFGPRALGSRSILADPRSSTAQKQLNLKIKFRESFRPFAPSVLREEVENWFELNTDSPYMAMVADVQVSKRVADTGAHAHLVGIEKLQSLRSVVPAITHVDYSARIQTVHKDTNPRFYAVIERFGKITGVPMLVNTSFNVRGEPIVETPEDAFRCFMATDLDLLVVGNSVLEKSNQVVTSLHRGKHAYALD